MRSSCSGRPWGHICFGEDSVRAALCTLAVSNVPPLFFFSVHVLGQITDFSFFLAALRRFFRVHVLFTSACHDGRFIFMIQHVKDRLLCSRQLLPIIGARRGGGGYPLLFSGPSHVPCPLASQTCPGSHERLCSPYRIQHGASSFIAGLTASAACSPSRQNLRSSATLCCPLR
jgi:hypothetical protein